MECASLEDAYYWVNEQVKHGALKLGEFIVEKPKRKILAFSDTHCLHNEMPPPPEHDLVIFAGDCGGERHGRFIGFLDWFEDLTDRPKIMTFGNHERWADKNRDQARYEVEKRRIHLLMNSGVCVMGLNIWGAPWTPIFGDWAFMSTWTDWSMIPQDTDVLVTHGPPKGILDLTLWDVNAGDQELAEELKRRTHVKAHLFGHIHEARGQDGIHYNVAAVDREYALYPEPWTVIEV